MSFRVLPEHAKLSVNTLKITCQKLEHSETCTQPILTHQSHMINVQLEAEYLQ